MLKRIYIDNFRCLVNFDLSVDYINLFLGPNGSGKSTVFDALRKIQAFVCGDQKVNVLFEGSDLTYWQPSPIQTFELEIEGNGGLYKYELAIEHDQVRNSQGGAQVAYERLSFDEKPLLNFEATSQQGKLYLDNQNESITIPGHFTHSAVDFFSSDIYSKLAWFKERMKRFIVVKVIPPFMDKESHQPAVQLTAGMENFVSWIRYIYQNQDKARQITSALEEVFEDLNALKFAQVGEEHRVLNLYFSNNGGKPIEYRFYQLSDGDRALIALYTLIHYARFGDYTICIDEPENFLALSEIQPWILELYDYCSDDELQAFLISHHPEIINSFALSAGYWFERKHNNAPASVKRITDHDERGLSIAELVSRGWIYDY